MKVLVLSPQVLYPQDSGGKKSIVGRLLNDFKNDEVDLIQINVNNVNYSTSEQFFKKYHINCKTLTPYFSKVKGSPLYYIYHFFSLFNPKPKYFQNYGNKSLVKQIRNSIDFDYYDLIICEQIYLAYLPLMQASSKVKIIIHNVEHKLLYDLYKINQNPLIKLAYYYEYLKVKKFERKAILDFKDNFVFLSDVDREDFQRIYSMNIRNFEIAKNKLFIEKKIIRSTIENFILFPGSLSFEPNYNGMNWFLTNCYTDLINHFPNLKILITGKIQHSEEFREYSNIVFTGYLDNDQLSKLFSKCILIISPILLGSGIKIKNLEAIQNGIPIIMTKNSAKGFDSYMELTNDPKDFLERTIKSIENTNYCLKEFNL